MKKIIFISLLLVGSLFAMSDKELAITINLAGKQRMLTQKMSKEALLIKLNIDKEENAKKLKESSALFDKTLNGLIKGDKDLKLVPTKDKKIQAKLQEVKKLWEPFYAKIKDIYSLKDTKDETFKYIEENNLKLLKTMNEAVYMYAKLGNKGGSKLKMANDINLAGKQRMLTQKIAKDLLLYQANLNPKEALKSLNDSIALFDRTLNGLYNGDKELNLVGTKLPRIRKQLDITKKAWQEAKPLIKQAVENKSNQELTKKAIEKLDLTKKEMNKAVELYTLSLNRQKQVMKLNNLINAMMHKKDNSKYIVNLAGRQRMLTQRVSKLAIECVVGVLPDSCNRLEKFLALYEKTLLGFLNGDKDLKLEPTKSEAAIAQIKKIQKIFKPFKEAAMRVQKSHGKDKEALKYIIENNEELLKESNELVTIFEKENSKNLSYIEKAQLKIVNIAGRQRMLTQKMTKEKLAILNLKMTDFKDKLQKSVKLFNSSLIALINGSNELGIPKATNPVIKKQLLKVSNIWKKIKPFYNKEELSKKELVLLLKANPILLNEMNKAVKLIEISTEY